MREKKKHSIKALITSVLLCVAMLAQSALPIFAAPIGTWTPNGYTQGDDGVYTSGNRGESTIDYDGSLDGLNTVRGTFLYNDDPTDAGGAYMGFQFWFNDTQFFIVRMYLNLGQYYTTNKPFFRAQKLTSGGYVLIDESPRLDRSAGFEKDTWIDFSVTLEDNLLVVTANGETMIEAVGFGEANIKRINVISSGEKVMVKDLKLSHKSIKLDDLFVDANWKEENVDGESVWTTSSDSAAIWYNGKDISSYNTIEADVCYQIPKRGDGGINLQVNHSGKAGTYIFNLAPNRDPLNPVARVFGTNTTNVTPLARREVSKGFGKTGLGDYVHMKLVLTDEVILCYINGVLAYKAQDPEEGRVWTRAGVNTFMCGASVKNIKLSKTSVNIAELGFIDLEFTEKSSIDAFTVSGGTLSHADGKLVATLGGNSMTLTSALIEEVPGAKYSMYMSLRNTFLVRMKNSSAADKVKLSFRTSESGDTWLSKTFDIKAKSEFETYYFNVSDLNPTGYLRAFSLEFVGGKGGSVEIDAITFEREDPIYDYLGKIHSCIAYPGTKDVKVIGTVNGDLDGKKVTIWQSSPQNYTDSLTWSGLVKLAEAEVKDGRFDTTFPLYKANSSQTQLSSYFIAEIDGKKVDEHFVIENYYDFNDDPDRFTIDIKKEVSVLDYGAKGDGFTDDTAAFQKAIDAVKAAGGGRVRVPGDESEYGKRYIITHIELCNNLEFVIEEGAVLWQSQREEELNKTVPVHQRGYDTVTYGHGVDIDGLVWCTGYSTVNLPLILINSCENVRITGGGTIRMNDAGGEMDDPRYFVGDIGLAVGQENRVQQIPLCTYNSKHVDITNLTLMRSNGWHCYMSFNNDVYVANIAEKEAVSVTADGFTITSCKNLTIDRCFTYTSDDAVGICTAYEDKRGQFYRPTKPGENNATENIVIRHSYLFGGFGISWMPWGAEAENLYLQETRNISIFDCSLGGGKSSGTWPDDPFYGWSSYYSYTQTEDNNYCPIKDVLFRDNEYLAGIDLTLNGIVLKATNFIMLGNSNGLIYCSKQFLNGDFDKLVHKGEGFKDETDFVTGLSYWSNNGNVGYELIGTKESTTVDTKKPITQNNYAGYIIGSGELYQGLCLNRGKYKLTIDTKTLSKGAKIFVRDAVSGEIIAEKTVSASDDLAQSTLYFENKTKPMVLHLGISLDGATDDKILIDNASVEKYSGEIPTDPPVTPDIPDTPDTTDAPDTPTTPDTTDTPNTPETPDTPKTMIPYIIIGAVILAAAAVVGVIVIKKKHKTR